MAKNTQLTNLAANTEADALAVLLNSGYLRLYDGTQPATGDTALAGNTLLAELTFSATAFGAAVAGVITANAIGSDASANATGTATFYRCFQSNGTTAVMDGNVLTSTGNLNLNSTAIQAGATVSCSAFSFTANKT